MSSQSKEVRMPAESGDQPAAAREVRTVAPTVAIEDLHAYYGDQHAVRGVSLTYAANEVTAMIGPSG